MDQALVVIGLLLLLVTALDIISAHLIPRLRRRRQRRREDGIDGSHGGRDDGHIGDGDGGGE